MDLAAHVSGESEDSGYVATSKFLASAKHWASENGYEYVYKLRGSGVDVNEAPDLTPDLPSYKEREIAIPGPSSAIEGVRGPGGWVSNPAFSL
jgi:hypothetical protein